MTSYISLSYSVSLVSHNGTNFCPVRELNSGLIVYRNTPSLHSLFIRIVKNVKIDNGHKDFVIIVKSSITVQVRLLSIVQCNYPQYIFVYEKIIFVIIIMYIISNLVKVTIPNYLAGLPIPDSIGGWFRLGGKELQYISNSFSSLRWVCTYDVI